MNGYKYVYRDPSASGSGRERDQQQWWAYVHSIGVGIPSISSIYPIVGPKYKIVTIDGTDFGSSEGGVNFGSYPATVLSWSSNQIKV